MTEDAPQRDRRRSALAVYARLERSRGVLLRRTRRRWRLLRARRGHFERLAARPRAREDLRRGLDEPDAALLGRSARGRRRDRTRVVLVAEQVDLAGVAEAVALADAVALGRRLALLPKLLESRPELRARRRVPVHAFQARVGVLLRPCLLHGSHHGLRRPSPRPRYLGLIM